MSRNLCRNDCYFCGSPVTLTGEPGSFLTVMPTKTTQAFRAFENMTVALAECPACLAQYVAWLGNFPSCTSLLESYPQGKIRDLSFRSTFNDEPGEEDKPLFEVRRIFERVKRLR